jgi:hypothetical protein
MRRAILTTAAIAGAGVAGLLLARWSDVGVLEERLDAYAADVDAIARVQDDHTDDVALELVQRIEDLERELADVELLTRPPALVDRETPPDVLEALERVRARVRERRDA